MINWAGIAAFLGVDEDKVRSLRLTSPSFGTKVGACIDRQPCAATDLCHYVIVRSDLPHGSQVAQVVHAVGESTPERVPPNTVAVALAARDEEHLLDIADVLHYAGIKFSLIYECDGQAMAIGCEPTRDRQKMRKALSSLPLVR